MEIFYSKVSYYVTAGKDWQRGGGLEENLHETQDV
jgi:hypothetical protein